MGRLDLNGETASLKKRKREQKDEADAQQKRLRSKHKSKHRASLGEDKSTVHTELVPVRDRDGDIELPDPSGVEAPRALPAWKVSNPMGGRMLDIDPIFSLDERSVASRSRMPSFSNGRMIQGISSLPTIPRSKSTRPTTPC